jgi:D-3-phosphoglycerate dehydrogenase
MRIAIPDDYQDVADRLACASRLAGHSIVRFQAPARDEAELIARLADADCIVAIRERVRYPRSVLAALPRLQLISQIGRSTHHIDVAACTDLGIAVAHGTSASPVAPAELTWALILAARRNIPIETRRMRLGEWPCTLSHRLRGSTLGIAGLGLIGELVAEAGRGFGMRVLCWGRERTARRATELGYAVASTRAQLFEEADVLSLHLRVSPETRHGITEVDLLRMKPTALIVNTARAALFAPDALVNALRKGRPGYAAVDVYDVEPVVNGDHPLLKMDNVTCVPHIGWAEHDTFELYFGEAYENVAAWAAGKPQNLVNPDATSRRRS